MIGSLDNLSTISVIQHDQMSSYPSVFVVISKMHVSKAVIIRKIKTPFLSQLMQEKSEVSMFTVDAKIIYNTEMAKNF